MANSIKNPLLGQQFAWFESMCQQLLVTIKKENPDSNALAVLEKGVEVAAACLVQYALPKPDSGIPLTSGALTILPAALTTEQVNHFKAKASGDDLASIALLFLTYSGKQIYDHAVTGPQAKEYLQLISKNIESLAWYADKLTQIVNEAQPRIALAKALYNQNQVNHND